MLIGEFTKLLGTTKDTIRHYEDLNLIKPVWKNNRKKYSSKNVEEFEVIQELKNYGLVLKDIQLIFKFKEAFGCSDNQLIVQTMNLLSDHLEDLKKQEREIIKRRKGLEKQINEIKALL